MSKLSIYRILAFSIDYLLIIAYGLLLFGVTTVLDIEHLSPLEGQIVGFLSLTLPVYLYFYSTERSNRAATLGKRVLNIAVRSDTPNKRAILKRNILKFLPWEIAHIGVHWQVYYANIDETQPLWVWVALIVPQIIVLGYLISIWIYKGQSSLYDRLAGTRVEFRYAPAKKIIS